VTEELVLSVIALYAVTSLAKNLASMMSKDPAPDAAWSRALNLLSCAVSVAVIGGMCEAHREYYVSQQDLDLYNVLLCFLVIDVSLLCVKAAGPWNKNRNFGHQVGLSRGGRGGHAQHAAGHPPPPGLSKFTNGGTITIILVIIFSLGIMVS